VAGRSGRRGLDIDAAAIDLAETVAFYERAGFGVRIDKDENGNLSDFAFVDFDGQSVFDLDVAAIDPKRNGAGCYLIVSDADDWHARLTATGLRLHRSLINRGGCESSP
jgi:predicted enzyme related to lactoylglutathione lyase